MCVCVSFGCLCNPAPFLASQQLYRLFKSSKAKYPQGIYAAYHPELIVGTWKPHLPSLQRG